MKQTAPKHLHVDRMDTPIGPVWLAADERGQALGISLRATGEQFNARIKKRFPAAEFSDSPAPLDTLKRWLGDYFAGKRPKPARLKWVLAGTAFQERVWQALAEVGPDELLTYGELAARVGCKSARAIGQAVGRNPLPILIPCHRIVAAERALGGFSSGIENKIKLLHHEGRRVDIARRKILTADEDTAC